MVRPQSSISYHQVPSHSAQRMLVMLRSDDRQVTRALGGYLGQPETEPDPQQPFCPVSAQTLCTSPSAPTSGSQAWNQTEQSSFSTKLTWLPPPVSETKPLESAWRKLVSSKRSLPAHLGNRDADIALHVLHTKQFSPVPGQTQVGFNKEVITNLFLFLESVTGAWSDTIILFFKRRKLNHRALQKNFTDSDMWSYIPTAPARKINKMLHTRGSSLSAYWVRFALDLNCKLKF